MRASAWLSTAQHFQHWVMRYTENGKKAAPSFFDAGKLVTLGQGLSNVMHEEVCSKTRDATGGEAAFVLLFARFWLQAGGPNQLQRAMAETASNTGGAGGEKVVWKQVSMLETPPQAQTIQAGFESGKLTPSPVGIQTVTCQPVGGVCSLRFKALWSCDLLSGQRAQAEAVRREE